MTSSPQDDITSLISPNCDYADCACDLHFGGDLDIDNIEFDEAQMASLDFANLIPSPDPTYSTDSLEWAEAQGEASPPTESMYMTGPVITMVKTERRERRKAQNREAQRAYRTRKDEQLKSLQQELNHMSKELQTVKDAYNSARQENKLLSCVVAELRQSMADKKS